MSAATTGVGPPQGATAAAAAAGSGVEVGAAAVVDKPGGGGGGSSGSGGGTAAAAAGAAATPTGADDWNPELEAAMARFEEGKSCEACERTARGPLFIFYSFLDRRTLVTNRFLAQIWPSSLHPQSDWAVSTYIPPNVSSYTTRPPDPRAPTR